MTETKLGQGSVQMHDFGTLKLHAWQTGDAMNDECFVLETPTNLVAVESPSFKNDIATWKEYVADLEKPLTDILISAHPAGGKWFGNATSHATTEAEQAITSGATKALTEYLGNIFGADFDTDIPCIDAILRSGHNNIGGIDVEIISKGDVYDIAIPAAYIIYTHMLGADTHSLLASQENLDSFLASLERMKSKGYLLILSGHHTPETQADVDVKIGYLKRVSELLKQSGGREEFICRVKDAYPDYAGLNYLDMTAGHFFKE